MFDRVLIDYLPPPLRQVTEFAAITDAQQAEVKEAWDALDEVLDNQFIDSATEDGVAVWEKELNITPFATDTLDDRKRRIKAAWIYGVVYTYKWLADWLKRSCGNDNPPPVLNGYDLRVSLPVSVDYLRILSDMRKHVSANVNIDPLILLSQTDINLYTGTAYRNSVKQTIQTDAWDMTNVDMLADENGVVLMEDAGRKILYEEVSA